MKLYIGISAYLLQQVRLFHAIAESGFSVVLPPGESAKYQPLKEYFGVEFLYGDGGDYDLTGHISIDHATPSTSLGNLSRPVVFPHAITEYCRSLWRHRRKFRFSFMGLVTEKREKVMETWIRTNLRKPEYVFPKAGAAASRTRNRITALFGAGQNVQRQKIGDLLIWSSDRGRSFPVKSWHDEYFRTLSNSKFVLCPNGDFVWSYRFFESILCGAIPVVEEGCPAYQGFRFYTMADAMGELEWRQEDAEYNYALCTQRITFPRQELIEHLNAMIGQ